MFAEDIGLLPRNYFTSLLYDGAKGKDVERRLHELFTQMNTRDLPAPRVVPYFNGGLFTDVTTLPLGDAQLMALTKAAEANWTFVDPHIFGSVFQGIMDDAERHASGAHYTAHDDIMRVVGPTIACAKARAGFVATSGIRVGNAREASLDYIVANSGTITNAVSSRTWPGESAVNVSMVNWVRGPINGPFQLIVDHHTFSVDRISTHLQLHADVSGAAEIASNRPRPTHGVTFGHEAFRSCGPEGFPFEADERNAIIRPVATGDDLLRGRMNTAPDYCIYLANLNAEEEARRAGGAAFEHLRKHVYPWLSERAGSGKETTDYATWLRKWWKPQKPREEFFRGVAEMARIMVCPKVSARPCFAFISRRFVPNNTMWVFAFDDDYSFGIVQSALHWARTKAKGGRTREDFTYSTEVWRTYPWPQEPTEEQVVAVAQAGRELRRVRAKLMAENGWSLRALFQAAEVDGPHPLKDAQAALDAAVADAYGIPPDQGPIEFLLELNQLVAQDEEQGRKVRGPGLPDHLDPKDPRWFSTDCIEPPPVES